VDSIVLASTFHVLHYSAASYESPKTAEFNEMVMPLRAFLIITPRHSMPFTPQRRGPCRIPTPLEALILYDAARESFADLDTKGIPVGIDKSFTYESRTVPIMPGSIGILYSDGLESSLNTSGAAYTTGRVKDIIRLNRNDTPAMLVRKIYDDFRNFTKGSVLTTDVSLIIFRCD
jgi:hypothetical protein